MERFSGSSRPPRVSSRRKGFEWSRGRDRGRKCSTSGQARVWPVASRHLKLAIDAQLWFTCCVNASRPSHGSSIIAAIAFAVAFPALPLPGAETSQQPAGTAWEILETSGMPHQRHECAFVGCDGSMFLPGGRRIHPVDRFDPATRTWTEGALSPVEIHLFQPRRGEEECPISCAAATAAGSCSGATRSTLRLEAATAAAARSSTPSSAWIFPQGSRRQSLSRNRLP